MKVLPDTALFTGLPGAGTCLSARLLSAFGEQRDRFTSAQKLQQYTGIALVTKRSGKKSWVHWRWQCPKFVRQTFFEWASHSIYSSYWANIFYLKKRELGNSHQVAVRALALKWIRIVYRCWQDHKPYNEVRYLRALKDHGSPLLE
jgi:transposase